MAKEVQLINSSEFFKMLDNASIQKAFEYIKSNNLSLKPSTKYSVIINDESFPPKDFLRIVAELKGYIINENTFSGGQANKPFQKLGYIIENKEMSENIKVNRDIFNKYWVKYKEYFRLPDSEQSEKYKWSVLKQVYDKWNWNVEDKEQMFKSTFDVNGPKNLWLSGNFYPISHTEWMFANFKNETIIAFNNLFNESLNLKDRLNSFIDFYDLKLPELQELVPDKKIQYHSHKDLRALGLYLTLQYPEKYYLFKFGMVKTFCTKFEIPKIKGGDKENLSTYLEIANQILKFIEEDKAFISEYREFTNSENNYNDDSLHLLVQDFIYTVANHFDDKVNYWRIGSNDGENYYYNEMQNEDYIAIGWNAIGDLEAQNVKSKKDVTNLLISHNQGFKTDSVRTRKAGEIYDFYANAKINDIVTLMDGNTVLAIGKIADDYNYNENLPFSHSREIIWLTKDLKNFIISDGPRTTFFPLTNKATINKINNLIKNPSTEDLKNNPMSTIEIPLNQILYGPPGTGKTYKTKKIAVEIIENQEYSDSKEDRIMILEKYDRYLASEQIYFTTFHQSMAYEDFIEGIKPKMTNANNGELEYEIKSGLFKQLCQIAEKKETTNFDTAYGKLTKDIIESEEEYLVLHTQRNKEFRVNVNSNGNLTLFTTKKINQYGTLTAERLHDFYFGAPTFSGWEGYANGILNHLEKKYNLSKERKSPNQKYVLIIDEINRGNVSAIFGELITLIETDKRAGQNEAISCILPYSKDKFSVPDNIYIVATMNTADRSVEALDTALRRRFSFKELLPNPKLLKDHNYQDVNLENLLSIINQRIELLVDKDHQIGHSYFYGIESLEDLRNVFKDKIVPLLEEYFYGDFGKIGLVLGENFIEPKKIENKSILAKFKAYEDIDFVTDKKIFKLTKDINEMNVEDFKSIYENQIQ